jgi:putative acetyltransferase
MTFIIRHETNADVAAIYQVNVAAFGRAGEAALVDALRAQGQIVLSLVAVQNEQIVGHILFSPVVIGDQGAQFAGVGLGPMAVLPAYQRHGVGSQLVQHGLDLLRAEGHEVVVVLGHPRFYPRFGFQPAAQHNIHSQWNVPADLFMAVELVPGALHERSGTVRYSDAFNDVT